MIRKWGVKGPRRVLISLLIGCISQNLYGADTSCLTTGGLSTNCTPCAIPPGNCTPCGVSTHDCDAYNTNPSPHLVTPQSSTRVIQVVWHIILGPSGEGNCSSQVNSQMLLLNDAFGARVGTPFASSVNTRVEFVLASLDPSGNPTTGINIVSNHPEWFYTIDTRNSVDQAAGTELQWDTTRYLNIITHGNGVGSWSAFPWDAAVTPYFDGVRLLYTGVGATGNSRVAIHEIGHYFGLFEEGWNVCGTTCQTSCYQSGDLACDTPTFVVCNVHFLCTDFPVPSCSVYSYGNTFLGQGQPPCWVRFSPEQTARMRCSLPSYRQSGYLGIVESSIQTTVTTFCERGSSHFQFTANYQTNVATTGANTDTLQVFLPGYTGSCTSTPWTTEAKTPNGVNHSFTIQRPCVPGTYTFNIRSRSGILGTRSMCRTFVVTSCPTCPPCDPPCELE